jgi:hypothetical protein
MPINFPANPTNGQEITHGDGKLVYNSTKGIWNHFSTAAAAESSGGGGASVTTSDTAPTSPNSGDQWFDTTSGTLYVYYNDGTSSQWIGVSGPSGADGADGAAVTSYINFAAFPSSGNAVGDFGFDLATGAIYNWSGSTWKRLYSGADESPTWTTPPPDTANLATDGTATNQTVAATDPEGFPIEYSYDTNPTNQTQATITNTGGNFTITPSTDAANNGSFTLRYKATDGIHVSSKTTTYSLNIAVAQSWTAVYGPVQGLSVTNTRNALALSGGQQNFNSHTTHSFRYWMINPIEMKGGGTQGDFQMASVQFQLNGSNVSWPSGAQVLNVYNGLTSSPDYGQPIANAMASYNNPQSLVDNDGTNAGGKHYFGGIQSTWSGSYFNFNIVIDAGQQITANEFNYWTGNDVTNRDSTGFWVYGSNISGDFQ